METDVAAFTRRLRQDGIDAARAEADRILEEARGQARGVLEEARAAAAQAAADAQAASERDRRRFEVEMGLAARDTLRKTRQEIEGLVMRLLRGRVAGALATDEVVRAAILEVIGKAAPGSAWEIGVGPRIGRALVEAAVSDLLRGREAAVAVVEESGRSGLEFRTAGGDEVVELSEESVAEIFSQMVSPELGRLIAAPAD